MTPYKNLLKSFITSILAVYVLLSPLPVPKGEKGGNTYTLSIPIKVTHTTIELNTYN